MKTIVKNPLSSIKVASVAALLSFSAFSTAYASAPALPQGKPFQQLQSEVDDLQTQLNNAVADLQGQIDDSNALIDQLFSITGENTKDIQDLQAYVAMLQQQLDLLQGNLAKDCGEGYFIQEIKSDGTPVCGKDIGVGLKNITTEAVILPVPYYPVSITCPSSHPRVVSGGFVETPVTSVVGSTAYYESGKPDSWLFLVNGVGAMIISAICATN